MPSLVASFSLTLILGSVALLGAADWNLPRDGGFAFGKLNSYDWTGTSNSRKPNDVYAGFGNQNVGNSVFSTAGFGSDKPKSDYIVGNDQQGNAGNFQTFGNGGGNRGKSNVFLSPELKPKKKPALDKTPPYWNNFYESNASPGRGGGGDGGVAYNENWNAGNSNGDYKTGNTWKTSTENPGWSSNKKILVPPSKKKQSNKKVENSGGGGVAKQQKNNYKFPAKWPTADEESNQLNPIDSNGTRWMAVGTGMRDTSVLDELEKNGGGYSNKEFTWPDSNVKSGLNIDLSELWDFDKRRGIGSNLGQNLKKNQKRKYRETKLYGECQCVDVSLCNEEDIVISRDEENQEMDDWRAITRCPKLTEVCCTKPKSRYTDSPSNERDDDFPPLSCGQRRFAGYDSAEDESDGTTARGGEFPWLLKLETIQEDLGCGASLVHPQLALTAAHCIARMQTKDLYVRAGMFNSNAEPFQVRKVTKIIVHPGYNSDNPRNDIALIVVAYPFKITGNVNTICLPLTNDRWHVDRCLVAGWKSSESSGVLRKGQVNFLPQRECQNIMRATDLWRKYVLHESFVCAVGRYSQDSCLGDEGSPVICPSERSPESYLQIGLVSKSMNCDNFGRPGIFTNLLKFIDWVNETAFELNLFDDFDLRDA